MPTVLITGASRGIGLEFTRQYAAAGWKVIATCRRPKKAKALNAVAGDVSVYALDVDDPAAAKALARKVRGKAIDVVINNAGVYGPRNVTRARAARGKAEFAAWGEVLRTNVMGPLAVSAALVPGLKRGKRKTIATVSSRMGSIGDNTARDSYIYRSSKAAVNAVMKTLANDLRGEGIKVVLFHPGWVRTDMGGPGAAIDAVDSVAGMRAVIARLKKADSGRFFNYDGTEIPW